MTTTPSAVRKCFVLSPIGEDGSAERKTADAVLKHVVKKALGTGWDVSRADDDKNPGAITPRILAGIIDADLIVADLSGANPNVFYELAVAHGYAKPTVHIQRAGERPPFDVKDMRVVRYDIADPDDLESAQKKLRDSAEYAVANPAEVETPLSGAARFAALHASQDPVAESNVQVMDELREVRREVRDLARRVSVPQQAPGLVTADRTSLMEIVQRVVADGRSKEADFADVITNDTTYRFDDWARDQLGAVMDTSDEEELNGVLFHPSVYEDFGPDDDDT